MLVWHDTVPSTQDLAHRLAEAGAEHGTAVAAREQTAGRGTRGRSWVSGRGGLWISVVTRPSGSDRVELLGLRAGLALGLGLETWSGGKLRVALKWPNDLYVGDRKLGGVLAEARWQGDTLGWVTIGVGLNLVNELPRGEGIQAVRAADFDWRPEIEQLAARVAGAVAEAARVTGALAPEEIARFAARDWLAGRRVIRPVAGVVRGLAPDGRLRIQPDAGPPIELLDSADLEVAS